MSNHNSRKVSEELLNKLSSRSRDVIQRRFGLEQSEQETLASIGDDYGVTRERIRQIEENALSDLKSEGVPQKVLSHFKKEVKKFGELRREDKLLTHLDANYSNEVHFLLTLGDGFERKKEDQELHTLWTINKESITIARETVKSVVDHFEQEGEPKKFEDIAKRKNEIASQDLEEPALASFIEVAKDIKKGPTGELGLGHWPEIKPRGVRDRAFLVLRNKNEPLHFEDVTSKINQEFPKMKNGEKVEALPQTVHNELIKDDRFVLVGRGIYALKDWGYKSGTVKDVIAQTLEEHGALSREEVVNKVLDQRMVKENTVLLNLQNEDSFEKTTDGKYTLKA